MLKLKSSIFLRTEHFLRTVISLLLARIRRAMTHSKSTGCNKSGVRNNICCHSKLGFSSFRVIAVKVDVSRDWLTLLVNDLQIRGNCYNRKYGMHLQYNTTEMEIGHFFITQPNPTKPLVEGYEYDMTRGNVYTIHYQCYYHIPVTWKREVIKRTTVVSYCYITVMPIIADNVPIASSFHKIGYHPVQIHE